EHAGIAEIVDVVTRAVAIRAGLSVTRDRAVDDAGVELGHERVADAELVHHAGAEALDDRIGVAREPQERVATADSLEVESKAALVAVDHAIDRRGRARGRAGREPETARVIPLARVLDLDHIGPEVGEVQRAGRAGQQAREIEHAQTRERRAQRSTPIGADGSRRTAGTADGAPPMP